MCDGIAQCSVQSGLYRVVLYQDSKGICGFSNRNFQIIERWSTAFLLFNENAVVARTLQFDIPL